LTGQQTLIARAVLGIVAGAASVAAVYNPRLRRLSAPRFDRIVTATFVLSRLGLFSLVFLVFRIAPRGDIPAYYWPEALSVLRGLMPYRDFVSSYAPVHPYVDAVAVSLWHTPVAIILLSILVEATLLPLWLRFGRELFSERELRTASLLYLTSAVSLQFVTIDGQDTVVISVLLTFAFFALARSREFLSGASVGLSIASIKFLPLIYAPAFFLAIRRRWRWTLGFAIPIVIAYGTFLALHLPILTPIQQEGNLKAAGNLPYLIESVLGVTLPSRLWDALLLMNFSVVFLLVWRVSRATSLPVRLRAITFGTAAITLSLVLFSKKSWPPYLMLSLFPISLLIDIQKRWQCIVFAAFGVIAVLEHSYWATLVYQVTAPELHKGLLAGQANHFVLVGLQVLLLGGYGWLLACAVSRILSSPYAEIEAAAESPAERLTTS
jgi:hypothetical protein